MNYKIGKVVSFDKYVGEIVDEDAKYLFLDTDLKDLVRVGDIVVFSYEKIGDENRNFFIEKFYDILNNNENFKQKIIKNLKDK